VTARRERAVFVISVAAEMSGMHPQTLRIYERRGLIEPYRTPGGTRRYSHEDIERLILIQRLTSQGLNLEGVRQVLDLEVEMKELRRQVDELRQRVVDMERDAERRVAEVHQSYRSELVLRSSIHPQRK
jgi:MerR family transcriptional regulator/heat shock protein HspR